MAAPSRSPASTSSRTTTAWPTRHSGVPERIRRLQSAMSRRTGETGGSTSMQRPSRADASAPSRRASPRKAAEMAWCTMLMACRVRGDASRTPPMLALRFAGAARIAAPLPRQALRLSGRRHHFPTTRRVSYRGDVSRDRPGARARRGTRAAAPGPAGGHSVERVTEMVGLRRGHDAPNLGACFRPGRLLEKSRVRRRRATRGER